MSVYLAQENQENHRELVTIQYSIMSDNKHTFHFWKTHPHTSAVHTQLAEAVDNPHTHVMSTHVHTHVHECTRAHTACIRVLNSLDQL